MITFLIVLCSLALMIAASRVGTAAIALAVLALAVLGWWNSLLYLIIPAVTAFLVWISWIYWREKKRISEEERVGRQRLMSSQMSARE